MEQKDPFYITTAIAYANAAPHIGHAFEFVTADVHARFAKQKNNDVFFVTGMDEHGQKIEEKAKEKSIPTQEFVDRYAREFQELDRELGVSYDFFVRTSAEAHKRGAQMLWNKIAEKGDLEKRVYSALYCVGCEEFKTEKDLNEQGECPIHLKKPEVVEEENYFFNLSKYTSEIKGKIESGELEIVSGARKNEILALLERGLEDVSFSRPKSKVSWGIGVPGDDNQVMYVWCDALANYITALGYGTDAFREDVWSNTTHVIGKDILRFHAAIWPGMLLSAGLPLPKRILVHGHITSGGQKMSKSLGNVIDPKEVIELFRPACGELAGEALRFVLLHEVPSFEDGDITMESIKTAYTAYLANGIGNLTNRTMKMCTSYNVKISDINENMLAETGFDARYKTHFELFNVMNVVKIVMELAKFTDGYIQECKPFEKIKVNEEEAKSDLETILSNLYRIGKMLQPIVPQTSKKILECIHENKMPEKPLFARLG